jgi:methylmalonyl-CoA mutase N-terminal domain/subunit
MFSGFGSPRDTNKRFKFLLAHGETGLSIAFDIPTLMGYDSDHPRAHGEVGREGVAVCIIDHMDTLFEGINQDKVTTSMTINPTAAIVFAFYIVSAEKKGIPSHKLGGTIQNDILKEYEAQKEFIFPPRPSLRLIRDTMTFASQHVPKWHPVSISGYHIREAGSTAVQELAYTLANGFTYVEELIKAGEDIDKIVPRFSFFFNSHMDFFEEIAKFRAARRIWAKRMREKYGAKNPEAWKMRFHVQTAGCSLTAQQPYNNVIRTTVEALAAVLGGCQSLHTNSMDEALALPTEEAVKVALRTQQVIAYETGIPEVIDPLAGSYYIEWLTNRMEQEAEKIFAEIEQLGGVVSAIEMGYFQKEIAKSAYQFQKAVENHEYVVCGVNEFIEEPLQIPTLRITEETEREVVNELKKIKQSRDNVKVKQCLEKIKKVAQNEGENLMPHILDAVRCQTSMGEIVDVLKEVWGTWQEPKTFW